MLGKKLQGVRNLRYWQNAVIRTECKKWYIARVFHVKEHFGDRQYFSRYGPRIKIKICLQPMAMGAL